MQAFVPFLLVGLVACQNWAGYDPLNAHNGLFRALPWTDYELAKISSMHSAAEYHNLMDLVKEKLIVSDIDPEDRRKIEQFLKAKRPPTFMKHMLSDDERDQIRDYHLSGEIENVLNILASALGKLTEHQRTIALKYLGLA